MGSLMVYDLDEASQTAAEQFFALWRNGDVAGIEEFLEDGDTDDVLLAGWSLAAALLNTQ